VRFYVTSFFSGPTAIKTKVRNFEIVHTVHRAVIYLYLIKVRTYLLYFVLLNFGFLTIKEVMPVFENGTSDVR
jgi:hypothetical protein